jgi:DNA-binding MarR family transcriptional regulator
MNKKNIPDIYNLLQEIAWHFGNHGFDGECCEDLSLVEFMALKKAAEKNNISIQEMAGNLKFTTSGATRIINRLENKGYVTRERSPVDGRVCCVPVTVKGTQIISKTMNNYTAYLEDMLKGLEQQKVDDMKEALEVLVKAIRSNQASL